MQTLAQKLKGLYNRANQNSGGIKMQKFSVRHPLIAGYIVTLITVMVFLALRSVVGDRKSVV